MRLTSGGSGRWGTSEENNELGGIVQAAESGDSKIFVITAAKAEAADADMTCQEALQQWESGYEAFKYV